MFTIAFCKHLAILKFKTLNHKCSVIRWTNNNKNVTPVKGSNVDTVTLSVLLSNIAINLIADLHARNVRGKLQVHIIHLLKYAKY